MLRRRKGHYITVLRNTLCVGIIVLVVIIYQVNQNHKSEVINKIPREALKYMVFKQENKIKNIPTKIIEQLIAEHNSLEPIFNIDIYGSVKDDTTILVIFTADLSINLKYLLVSLSQVWGIENVLIIFSHLYYDENINGLIQTVDFARVLQIYYPYSVQIYPNQFPGYNSKDCRHNMDIKSAEAANCTSAFSPDIHGRYREPLQAQEKHYWWWTMNKVFDNLTVTTDHSGKIIFLDKDLFLIKDFIYMLLHMEKVCKYLAQCDFLSVETSSFSRFYENKTWEVELSTWDPKYHSSVLAFDSSVWNSIISHYDLFCSIDDYSWSQSLYYLSLHRTDGNRFKVMTSTFPRAFKTNYCGLYGKILDCDIVETVYQVTNMQIRNENYLFPVYLELYVHIELDYDDLVIFDYVGSNGGWNDPRDKKMCSNMTTNKIEKVIMDMKNQFRNYEGDD